MSPTTIAFLVGVLVGLALWACLFVAALHLYLARQSKRRADDVVLPARLWRDVP